MKKITTILLLSTLLLSSCADDMVFRKGGKKIVAEPYGWADYQDKKIDSIVYKVSVGNVVWSILLCETIIAPIILTGWYLFEPVRLKEDPLTPPTIYNDSTFYYYQ